MYFTYVVRPGEAPEGRGPQFEPFWSFCVNYNLRLGLLIQLAAYVTLLATTASGGKDPLSLLRFLRCNPESVGMSAETFFPALFHNARTIAFRKLHGGVHTLLLQTQTGTFTQFQLPVKHIPWQCTSGINKVVGNECCLFNATRFLQNTPTPR